MSLPKGNIPTNTDDVIDSRDVIARIEEIEAFQEAEGLVNTEALEELHALKALADEAEGCGDWKYGETLVRASYFQDYAQQLAEDCGMINSEATWSNDCIDWERAARELQYDYTSVDFDGVTYWLRS